MKRTSKNTFIKLSFEYIIIFKKTQFFCLKTFKALFNISMIFLN